MRLADQRPWFRSRIHKVILRVPDQLLKKRRRHFKVELKSIALGTISEHLIRCQSRRSQTHAARRDFKHIPMPVRGSECLWKQRSQRIIHSLPGEGHWIKTYFLLRGAPDLRAKRPGDQLTAKTQAEDRLAKIQGRADYGAFLLQIGIIGDLIGTLSATAQRDSIEFRNITRQRFPGIRVDDTQRNAQFPKDLSQQTRLVDIPMLNEENIFHFPKNSMGVAALKPKKVPCPHISELPSG